MKTYRRIIIGLLILTTLLWAMVVSAQEKTTRQSATTIKPQPSAVTQTRADAKSKPTPTPTPNPRFKLPSKITVEKRLPDVLKDRDQQKDEYPRMPGLTGVEVRRAESTVRQIQPNARISLKEGQYTNNYVSGVVVNHIPERGSILKPGTEVILYYNPQQSRFPKMPNLIGVNIAEAEMRLFRAAPRTQSQRILSRRHNPNYGDDAVVAQSPDAGTELSSDVRVVLYVNSPPVYPKMPDLVGMDIRSAQAKLSGDAPNYPQRSIEESEFNPRFKPGEVVNQIPRAGMTLQPRGVAVLYYNPQQPKVTVPDVMGLTVPNAVRRIEQNNLVARFPRRGVLDSYIVTGQLPQAGTVLEVRSPVTLTVAATVVVPEVRRSLLNEAQQAISQNKLTVGTVTTRISSVRQDEVISQTPLPNSIVVEGTAVNLVIAKTQQVQVPNILNQPQGSAEQVLTNARLVVGQVANRASPLAAGTVLDQSPRPGTMVNLGSQVSLVVAVPQTVPVPNLRGRFRDAAGQMVRSSGLVVGQVTTQESDAETGSVLSQTPAAGTLVPVGSQVNLVVAEPLPITATPTPTPSPTPTPTLTVTPTPDGFLVPDVRRKELTEAISLLRASQLDVGEVTKEDQKETASFVLKQQPEAGLRVAIGTRVNLVIGKKPDGGILKELPKILGVGALGFMALLFARLWKRFRVRPHTGTDSIIAPPDPEPPTPAPALSFRTTMNASSSEFATSTEFQTSYALRFQPRADWGQQHATVDGYLIAAESEEL